MKTMRTPPDPPGCQCVVTLTEMGVTLEALEAAAAALGVPVELVEDWRGLPALSVADARRFRLAQEAAQAEHDAAWRLVVENREERKRQRQAEQQAQFEEARRLQAERTIRLGETAARDMALTAAREEGRVPTPPPDLPLEEAKKRLRRQREVAS